MSSIKETLQFMSLLQEVDKKLFYLEFSRGDLPKTVTRLKEEMESFKQQIGEAKNEMKNSKKERLNIENLVELANDKLKKYQNQLYDVTSNKEYDAITQEIELKKQDIEEGETNILELIELDEKNQNMLEEFEGEYKQTKSELGKKEKELNALLKATEKQELELNHRREKITVRLKEPMLKRYERIRKAKSNVAVVPITREACGGCFKTIPPQKIVEVEKLLNLIQCEVCGRLLIPENKLDKIPI